MQDQRWISNTLFQSGKLRPDLKLWYEPPVPALIYHQAPTPDRFFTHRLMVWMPYHLWRVRVFCPACGKQLTGYGVHKRARKVLDVDRYYSDLKKQNHFLWHRKYVVVISGTSANALNFQLYLLEGLNRWNQDRGAAAVTSKQSCLLTYAGDVCHSVNTNSLKVFGEALVPTFRPPARYTGIILLVCEFSVL